MNTLDWSKLLNENRRKYRNNKEQETSNTKGNRTEIERDYDRILFASPTRRLADKTQVYPLDFHDSVRTRLTHSHEVANLARSIGMELAFTYPEKVFGKNHEALNVKRKIPSLLAAVGLVHDLGNPPFGHQGEEAVKYWFNNKNVSLKKLKRTQDSIQEDVEVDDQVPFDFLNFDGNPQTFRLVTKLQIHKDEYGLNLTYASLAALVKYPFTSSIKTNSPNGDRFYSKALGIFESEKDILEEVWEETGLSAGVRHPLAHVMEACDDIAYAVIDSEDTVKKGLASFSDVIDHLNEFEADPIVKEVIDFSVNENSEFKKNNLSSAELNDVSMQMFRVKAIYELIKAVSETFVDKIDDIMNCTIPLNFELIKHSKGRVLVKALKDFGKRHGFDKEGVISLEVHGHNHILKTMDMLWEAIGHRENLKKEPFARYAWSTISENYRRVHKSNISTGKLASDYIDFQLLADSISGMTDSYLIRNHDKLKRLYEHK